MESPLLSLRIPDFEDGVVVALGGMFLGGLIESRCVLSVTREE